MYNEDDLLPLSGIMHFAFCPRRWALIHIEQQWQENLLTVKGHIFHEMAHEGKTEKRGALIQSRALPIVSYELGLRGQCDVVEWRASPEGVAISGREGTWLPMPIEYKRGEPGTRDHADELQVCAQAMCLEDMCLCPKINTAQLYYGEVRRRTDVELTDELRQSVRDSAKQMHAYFDRGYTPRVKPTKACRNCSLSEVCLPALMRAPSASDYLRKTLEGDNE